MTILSLKRAVNEQLYAKSPMGLGSECVTDSRWSGHDLNDVLQRMDQYFVLIDLMKLS